MELLLSLLLAHFLGDFLLQPKKWVEAKEKKHIKAYELYLHGTIHGVLVMLLVWDVHFWPWALLLSGSHLLIDALKIFFQRPTNRRVFFFVDQLVHLLIIVIVWIIYTKFEFDFFVLNYPSVLLLVTALYLLTQPTSVLIRIFISKWTPKIFRDESPSLQSAGMYIGFLERLLVFVFILAQHWEAIGFLITAKSVFRYGDLKDSKDTRLTEYILIGTLLSFGIAITIGAVCHYLL